MVTRNLRNFSTNKRDSKEGHGGSTVVKTNIAVSSPNPAQFNPIQQFQDQLNTIQIKYESQLQKLTEKCEQLEHNLINQQIPSLIQRQKSFDVAVQTDKEKRDVSCQSARCQFPSQTVVNVKSQHECKNKMQANVGIDQPDQNCIVTTSCTKANEEESKNIPGNHSTGANILGNLVENNQPLNQINDRNLETNASANQCVPSKNQTDSTSKINFEFNDLILDNCFVPWRESEAEQVPIKLPSIKINSVKTTACVSKAKIARNNSKGDIALITTIRGLQSELESAKQEIRRLKLKDNSCKRTNADRWRGIVKVTVGTQTIGLAASTAANYNPAVFNSIKATFSTNCFLKTEVEKLEAELKALRCKRTEDLKLLQQKHEAEVLRLIQEREVLQNKLEVALLRLPQN